MPMVRRTAARFIAALLVASGAVGLCAAAEAAPARPRLATVSVSQTPAPDAFPLATPSDVAAIGVEGQDARVVHIAANLLAEDMARVTGRKPAVGRAGDPATDAVLIGTLGSGGLIDQMAASGKLDASAIRGKWEAYTLAVVANPAPNVRRALVIAGSDRRGTAYGVMALSEAIGVSPWCWWADVPAPKRPALYVSIPGAFHDAPAVRYRGIFINDEDWGLNPWAKDTFDPKFKNIGPKTYAKVFELMLRLRLNYIWPAMHACSTEFGSVPQNARLADEYGIVAGSSHCEPMLYNNIHWDQKARGPWNYSTNRDAIHSIWEDTAKARGDEEAVWTLGIRGIHDAPMQTPPRDTPGKIKLLTDVFRDQRELLGRYASRQWGPVAQCFVPYKEVLPVYDAGLKVPDDVTLVWVDDNFGYIRRLSGPQERKRSGGSGVYYHISYYGQPHSYTWIDTTPPTLIWEELHKAWENDARTLWVLNVGDIKPMEIGIDYYARLAWDTEGIGPDSQPAFLRDFASRNFGDEPAQAIADMLMSYYRLGTIRKPELMNRGWALSLPPERAVQLAGDYRDLLQREANIEAMIPAPARDACTEMIGFPAHVLGETGLIFLADRNAQLGEDAAGNQREITRLRDDLAARVAAFNTKLAGGKWNHMMPGLVTGKDLTKWSSQVRWPWGEKPQKAGAAKPKTQAEADRPWRDAASADRQSASGPARWVAVPGLGQSGHAMSLQPGGLSSAWKVGDPNAPSLEFDFTASGGDAAALIEFLPTFRVCPGMKLRVAVSVDDQPPAAIEVPGSSGAEDERGRVRADAVENNCVRARVSLPGLAAGKHVLRIHAVDPGAVIDRMSLP
jgi:hypothetical protein